MTPESVSVEAVWPWVLSALSLVLSGWTTCDAVLRKRDVRAAIGWTGLAWLVPILGPLAYFFFGINRIQRRAGKLGLGKPGLGKAPAADPRVAGLAAGLAEVGAALSGKALTPGNRVDCLIDGDQTFPAMIQAIDGAERSITLQTFIFNDDRAGEQVFQALLRARDRGVAVRVLVDDIGTVYSKTNMVRRLQDSGITAAGFLPARLGRWQVFANLRNHRKILVVDGRIGFTGGTNIKEAHCLDLNPVKPTRCLHFRIEGPVVGHLQDAFATDWAFTTGEALSGTAWFSEPQLSGPVWARGIAHGPDEDFETLGKVIFAALSVARERVRIFSPYFLPDPRLVEGLSVAALRGAAVEIYLPADNNVPLVEWAATAQLDLVLQNGCRVFVTQPPFDHTKLMIVDDVWALIGSTNWDPRSLRLNFEFNVECYDMGLAETLHRIADDKAKGAREITQATLAARPYAVKLRDGLARLLSPYL